MYTLVEKYCLFCVNDTATTEIYTLSLHDPPPIFGEPAARDQSTDASGNTPLPLQKCVHYGTEPKGWSFRDLDRDLRSNLIYRRFTRFDAEATPTYSAFSRLFAVLSPEATQQIHHRVVGLAREKGAAPGHKIRIDSTVVESNVHYPSDSTLLGDGIRVLSRALKRMAAKCQAGALEVVNRSEEH